MLKASLSYQDLIEILYPGQSKIKEITFQVTENCNLCCTYCYQINKSKNRMTFETAKKFIDYIFLDPNDNNLYFNKNNTSGFIIDFIGGEPFLEIDLITQIVEYFETKLLELNYIPWILNHTYNFSSNGTLYRTEKVQEFLNKYNNLVSIAITVDGNKELHDSCRIFPDNSGSYDYALDAALEISNKNYSSSTKITLSPENISYLFEGVKDFISKGFYEINMNCCFEDVWTKESCSILLNQLLLLSDWIKDNNLYNKIYISLLDPNNFRTIEDFNKQWCGAGTDNMLSLNYKGELFPCIRFMNSSLGNDAPEVIIGNIEHGLYKTESEKINQINLQSCTKEKILNEECKNCPIGQGCSWCLGFNYQITKDFKEKINTICNPYKITALASKYLCKITKDKNSYDKINLSFSIYENLITKKEFDKIIKGE